MSDETPLLNESLTSAPTWNHPAAHIDLRRNLQAGAQQYRESDPTPEDAARLFVRCYEPTQIEAVVGHLRSIHGCTEDRARKAVANQVKNGRLILDGAWLSMPVETQPASVWPWIIAVLVALCIALGAWLVFA